MLTARDRKNLRDRIAREAAKQRVPNPLLTSEEKENERLDVTWIALRMMADDPEWDRKKQYLSHNGTKINDHDEG